MRERPALRRLRGGGAATRVYQIHLLARQRNVHAQRARVGSGGGGAAARRAAATVRGARQAGGGVGVGQVPERAARGAGLGAAQPALLRGELGEGHRATRRLVVFILVQGGASAPVERVGARGVKPRGGAIRVEHSVSPAASGERRAMRRDAVVRRAAWNAVVVESENERFRDTKCFQGDAPPCFPSSAFLVFKVWATFLLCEEP